MGDARIFTGYAEVLNVPASADFQARAFTAYAETLLVPASADIGARTYTAYAEVLSSTWEIRLPKAYALAVVGPPPATVAVQKAVGYAVLEDPAIAAGVATDPDFDTVVLLCHFDGADNQTTTIDSGARTKTLTLAGNAKLSTAEKKFGASSLLLDGTGDYLTTPDSDDWSFGSQPFTVEGWFRLSAHSTAVSLIGQWEAATGLCSWSWYLGSPGGNLVRFRVWSGTAQSDYDFTWAPNLGQWYHLALDKTGTTLRFYVDGAVIGTATMSVVPNTAATGALRIGRWTDATPIEFNGHIDEVRISKGIARYQGAFTPQTQAFGTVPAVVTPGAARRPPVVMLCG